jgi:hypothetical protein
MIGQYPNLRRRNVTLIGFSMTLFLLPQHVISISARVAASRLPSHHSIRRGDVAASAATRSSRRLRKTPRVVEHEPSAAAAGACFHRPHKLVDQRINTSSCDETRTLHQYGRISGRVITTGDRRGVTGRGSGRCWRRGASRRGRSSPWPLQRRPPRFPDAGGKKARE